MRFRVAFLGLCFLLTAAEVWAAEKTPREVYDQLNTLRVDPATLYEIDPANRIELRRGDVQLSFEQGKLAFLQLFEGRATGAVFYGRAHMLATLNSGQSLRVLFDSLSQTPKPYFFGAIDGVTTGPFDLMLDPLRRESLLLGQPKKNGVRTFYDVWASYNAPGTAASPVSFRALRYSIDTSILANNSLEAKTEVRFRAETG